MFWLWYDQALKRGDNPAEAFFWALVMQSDVGCLR